MTTSDISTVPDRSTVLAVMRSARRAPSVHNTQPWTWVMDGPVLRLHRDGSRRLDTADPSGRQLVISCGAMLHHVRTAFAAAGWHTDISREFGDGDLLATLTFRPWPDPPPGVAARAEAMARRRTDRRPMREPRDWDELAHTLRMLVSPHDVELTVLPDSARPRLAVASEHTAALHRYDMSYQHELHWWTGHAPASDGIPRSALPSAREAANTPVGRSFPSGDHARDREEFPDRARVVVLGTAGDSVPEWLHVGEALSAVLLECTAEGVCGCPLTHLTEVPAARRVIAGLVASAWVPQVVVRIGADEGALTGPATPRRPVEDFLSFRQ